MTMETASTREQQRRRSTRWFWVFAAGLLLLFGALIARLAHLQLVSDGGYRTARGDQTEVVKKRPAPRGNIYDRTGRLLVTSRMKGSIYADPGRVRSPRKTAGVLHEMLGVDQDSLLEKLNREHDRFVWVKRYVSPGRVRKVKHRSLRGVRVRREYTRTHPFGTLGAHVLGFVGTERTGLAGVERVLDRTLTGTPGQLSYLRDGTGTLLYRSRSKGREPVPGTPVTLTLDVGVQQAAEQSLRQTMEEFRANWASVVAMDPDNGAVLAMANRPSYHPESFQEVPADHRRNRAVTDPVEPGSSFKPIVMAAALEKGILTPDTEFFCENGAWSYRGRLLHDYKSFGKLSATGILEHSSNIGMAKIGIRLGKALRPWIKRFRFGTETGIQLPGEAPGFVQTREKWNPIYTQTSVPMGHEILTTPLQIVRSYCVFANGGYMVAPKLIRRNGNRPVIDQRMVGKRILHRDTTRTMINMMRSVVESGTGTPVQSEQITIAGKTGTSRKYTNKDQYLSIFIGVAPVSDPEIVVGGFVDEPQGEHSGGKVAGPLVRRVIEQAKHHLNLPAGRSASDRTVRVR